MNEQGKLRIQQYRSGIGFPLRQKQTLAALGLGKINRIVEKPDNPCIRGMVKKIPHLVRILDESTER